MQTTSIQPTVNSYNQHFNSTTIEYSTNQLFQNHQPTDQLFSIYLGSIDLPLTPIVAIDGVSDYIH